MIANHDDFLEAIRRHKLVRVAFYSLPDHDIVDRECAPLEYAPAPGKHDPANRYWVWDPVHSAGANPLGLSPDQIVSLEVLGKDFDLVAYRTAAPEPPTAANART